MLNYVDLSDLAAGTVVAIVKIAATDVWVQSDQGKWIALAYKGERNARTEMGGGGLQVRVLADSLNVRSGPDVEQALVDQLKKDVVAPLEAVDGKDAWGEMDLGKWIALAVKGGKFVEAV